MQLLCCCHIFIQELKCNINVLWDNNEILDEILYVCSGTILEVNEMCIAIW